MATINDEGRRCTRQMQYKFSAEKKTKSLKKNDEPTKSSNGVAKLFLFSDKKNTIRDGGDCASLGLFALFLLFTLIKVFTLFTLFPLLTLL